MTDARPARKLVYFIGFWLVGIAWMGITYARNPVDPTLIGVPSYGTTSPGELALNLGAVLVEFGLSIAILRPWSFERSWIRALIMFLLLTPWVLLAGVAGIHAGPTTHVHHTWLLIYWLCVVVVLAASVTRGVSDRLRG